MDLDGLGKYFFEVHRGGARPSALYEMAVEKAAADVIAGCERLCESEA